MREETVYKGGIYNTDKLFFESILKEIDVGSVGVRVKFYFNDPILDYAEIYKKLDEINPSELDKIVAKLEETLMQKAKQIKEKVVAKAFELDTKFSNIAKTNNAKVIVCVYEYFDLLEKATGIKHNAQYDGDIERYVEYLKHKEEKDDNTEITITTVPIERTKIIYEP